MHLKSVAIAGLLASSALAANVEDDGIYDELFGNDETAPSKSTVDHPAYTALEKPANALLFEQFDEGAEERWQVSNAKKNDEFSYVGKWKYEEATVFPGFKGDRGLLLSSVAAHHAITSKFDKPLDNSDKTLVVQYEVKLQNGLECGGAYLKLLSDNSDLHSEEFSNETPFQIMFGPDKCGSTNKVHFIIRRKNPKTGEYEEKHLALPPAARLNKLTNLYTLILHPNQDYEIRINGEVSRAGSLLEESTFKPSLNPPKEIEDASDVKPADWVDDEMMLDPTASKPDDWDEDAAFQIPDPDSVKPDDWLEDVPEYIADPDAEIPEDWDEEEDGKWVAPEVPNPDCVDSKCGPWESPMIRNPNYKGKWVHPKIENPDYKGPWTPKKISNPDYYEDSTPSNLEPIGAIGFELWTMQNNILFNNLYIGHSVEEAEYVGNQTFVPKLAIEKAEQDLTAPEPTPNKEPKQYESAMEFFRDDPLGFIVEVYRVFILNFTFDPIETIKNQPIPALGLALAILSAFGIVFGTINTIIYLIFGKSKPNTKGKGKEKETQQGDVKAEATSTSLSTATQATKRKA